MSQEAKKGRFTKFTLHRPADNRDPGFLLPGFKLRWLSNLVSDRRAGRIWEPLRVSDLPEKLKAHLKQRSPIWGKTDGDTIRRGGDVLAFAPIELCQERRKEINELTALNEGLLKGKHSHGTRGEVQSSGSVEKKSFGPQDFS